MCCHEVGLAWPLRPHSQHQEFSPNMGARLRDLLCAHRAEELGRLLQEAHQAALSEVPAGAHAVLVRRQGVFRDGRFLQHIGRNVLRQTTVQVQRTGKPD